MSALDPWAEIAAVGTVGNLHARRVDHTHRHEFYWGRDAQGHRLLVYQPNDELDEACPTPRVRGVILELTRERFVIRLIQNSDLEIFTTLCWSLIERTRSAQSSGEVLATLIAQLERWQRFLGKSDRDLLSDEEIRGLFCELGFLEVELIPRFGTDAIRFWRGPDGAPQDFAVGDTLFEVKSHLAGASPVVMISSAEQLWSSSGTLFLVAYTIGEATRNTAGALSLAQRVGRLRALLLSPPQAGIFEDRLMQAGYLDNPEYARRFFTSADPDSFLVTDAFPRITADRIPPGVCRVKYGIELAACLPFRGAPDWTGLRASHGS